MSNVYGALYRSDFVSFVPFAFKLLFPASDFYRAFYIDEIAQRLQNCLSSADKRVGICMPPRHLKSFIASIAYPAWAIAGDPRRRIVVIAGTRTLRNELYMKFRDLVNHPRFRSVFPELSVYTATRSVRTRNGGLVEFYTINESLIGKGADIIVIDDPVSPSDANEPRKLEQVNQWYDDNVFQRLDDKKKGVVVLAMQRLSWNDLAGHLEAKTGWTFLRYSAVAEQDVERDGRIVRKKFEPLNSNLGTINEYRDAMLKMGARTFMAQYQQRPYAKGEGEYRRGLWSNLRQGVPWKVGDPMPVWAFAVVDEHKILLHTVFGLGEHPWPDDMRQYLCGAECLLSSASDKLRYDLIQLMTPEQREAHGIDPSGKVFPDFTPYLSDTDTDSDEKSEVHNPDFKPAHGSLFKPLMRIEVDDETGVEEEVYGFEVPFGLRFFDYVNPGRNNGIIFEP